MIRITIPLVEIRTAEITPSLIGLFWSKVDKPFLNACWPWRAALNDCGYGCFFVPGVGVMYAHRFAYALKAGGLKVGEQVRHNCDNAPCCNPWHLIGGTAFDNAQDALVRGRTSHSSGPKLTNSDRAELIAIARTGLLRTVIAKRFNVGIRAVYRALENHRL